jgi:hypothetical protein
MKNASKWCISFRLLNHYIEVKHSNIELVTTRIRVLNQDYCSIIACNQVTWRSENPNIAEMYVSR